MSSPKAATAASRPRSAAGVPSKSPRPERGASPLSAEAIKLAAQVEDALQQGHLDALTPQAQQALMAAGCKLYGAQVEAGRDVLPLGARTTVTPTEVMTTASGLLRAVNLAVFELGMWQSWTGR